jgi:hypothetical protein
MLLSKRDQIVKILDAFFINVKAKKIDKKRELPGREALSHYLDVVVSEKRSGKVKLMDKAIS